MCLPPLDDVGAGMEPEKNAKPNRDSKAAQQSPKSAHVYQIVGLRTALYHGIDIRRRV